MFDLTPLTRSAIGFDRLASALENFADSENGHPPCDIEIVGENEYRISVAAAGFAPRDVDVEVRENALIVTGRRTPSDETSASDSASASASDSGRYLRREISSRGFTRRFQLAEFVEPVSAEMKDGILRVSLRREVPEAMKPRRLEVSAAT